MFPSQALPVDKLLDRLFLIIQSEWIRAKPAAAAPAAPTVLDQIEQLNDLKNKGISTEDESQNKPS
ncbi:hypothetical protein [Chitinophaga sp. LS1]|uniref:hypothetical protein n=1 Tax=Chitinophaga sp. LS1 TaxID=3051176 RepID=UPI002AAB27C8|nr:hypothetical protein [Chitinophaga sp. LS1]WPV65706.1 hypothetical protein QQL36_28300 [Chitinophaga sp. LS1]